MPYSHNATLLVALRLDANGRPCTLPRSMASRYCSVMSVRHSLSQGISELFANSDSKEKNRTDKPRTAERKVVLFMGIAPFKIRY